MSLIAILLYLTHFPAPKLTNFRARKFQKNTNFTTPAISPNCWYVPVISSIPTVRGNGCEMGFFEILVI